MIKDRKELQERREANFRRARNRKKALNFLKVAMVLIGLTGIFLFSNKPNGEMDREYSIPIGAISGGEYVGSDGVRYERFQLENKFFVLSKSNGSIVPK